MPEILEDAGSPSSDTPPFLGQSAETAVGVLEMPSAEPPVLGLAAEASIESFIHDSLTQAADALSVERLATYSALPDHLVRPLKRMLRELKAPELYEPGTCELLLVISKIIDRKTPARARLDNFVEFLLKRIEADEQRMEADAAEFDTYYAALVTRTSNQGGTATAESDSMNDPNSNDDDAEDIEPLNDVTEEAATQLNKLRKRLTHQGYFAANKLLRQLTELKQHPTLTTRAEHSLMLDSIVELMQLWQPGNRRNSHKEKFKNALEQVERWRDLIFHWRLEAREQPVPKPIQPGLPWERLSLAGILNRIDRVEEPVETPRIDEMIRELEQLRDQLVSAQLIGRYNRLIKPST